LAEELSTTGGVTCVAATEMVLGMVAARLKLTAMRGLLSVNPTESTPAGV
jgi:hypothetical protein